MCWTLQSWQGLIHLVLLHLLPDWLWHGFCKTWLCPLGVLSPRGMGALGRNRDGRDPVMAIGLTACLCLVPVGEERGRSCAHRWGTVPITGWSHPDANPAVLVCTAVCMAQAGLDLKSGECHWFGHL